MSKLLTTILLSAIILTFMMTVPSAFAAPVQNPENRHYYELVDSSVAWEIAKFKAETSEFEGARGYLATITSQSENDFVSGLITDDSHVWIGLSDTDTEGVYKWVTGEPFSYTNWNTDQPDNHNNNEDYVEFYGSNGEWNDNSNNSYNRGYIIEYPIPSGVITYNPDNGHYYEYINNPDKTWFSATIGAVLSEFKGDNGYLVTITSQSENDFVANLVPNDARVWIGLTDKDTEGVYKWVNGEPFSYSNWNTDQPDNHNNNEDYIHFLGHSNKWNDISNDYDYSTGYVIEYSPPVLNPENGHYYKVINVPGKTWVAAKYIAEASWYNGIYGHLATITSQSENHFVANLVPNDARVWIGLSDVASQGDYAWVTGEPFSYSSWDTGQPDNYNYNNQPSYYNEDYIEFLGYGKWNDISNHYGHSTGYVIEYSTLKPVFNQANGHFYEHIADDSISWTDAKGIAESSTFSGLNGHLVTITSQSENDFIAELVPDDSHAWVGLSDVDSEGDYTWVTGEMYNYTNWDINQPGNSNNQDYVEFNGHNNQWYDKSNDYHLNTGYVIEYSPPAKNHENGHFYEHIADDSISWTDAKGIAESSTFSGLNGHLVTITSQSENDFIAELVPDDSHAWVGLSDVDSEGDYTWVNGEPFDYSNWDTSQPDNANNEDYVEFNGNNDKWNDNTNSNGHTNGYVVEYGPQFVLDDPVKNPANGHYYNIINTFGISWTEANAAAESSTFSGLNGHLVTITSQSENDFVAGLVPNSFRAWIGLTDEETEGVYQWVTGEPFEYSIWSTGQPNNHNNQDYVEFWGHNDKWYDNANSDSFMTGYIIEYRPPDTNPVYNPDNGHYYDRISAPGISWTDAKRAAESFEFNGIRGHLVTITSESEHDFVYGLNLPSFRLWIGLTDEDFEGYYQWVTDEPFDYSNWIPHQPDNAGNEDYIELIGSEDKWNDNQNESGNITGYLIEYTP